MSSRVVDSRPYADSPGWRRRRRHCDACGLSWSTIEVPMEFLGQFRTMQQQVGVASRALAELDVMMRGLGSLDGDK